MRWPTLLGCLFLCCLLTTALAQEAPWVLVDTKARTVTVRQGNNTLARFDNARLGSSGAGVKLRQGDNTTPVGTFRVTDVRPSHRYKLFIELDYPNRDYARLALFDGRIKHSAYRRITAALDRGRMPPANGPLGGLIGIHGVGRADPRVHAVADWTAGCVALDDQQIRQLAGWVEVGTRVEIR